MVGRLFWKFFFFTLLAQLTAAIGIGGTIWLKNHGQQKETEEIDMSRPAEFIIESAAATLQYGGVPALRSLVQATEHRHQIAVVDDDNRDLLGRTIKPQVLAEARYLLQTETHRRVVRQVQTPDGQRYLLFLPSLGRSHDPGAMGAASRLPPRGGDFAATADRPAPPRAHDEYFLPFVPIASATLASLIFAALLAWYFSKPIRNLRSAFEGVAAGDLDVRVGTAMGRRRDELADLGRDFDSMADRLLALMNGQRRLLHDVSHELRSPLARLQAAIGLARQQPEQIEQSMERIERESVRMDKLVGELLTLAKLETGTINSMQEEIDMQELLAEIVSDASFEASASVRKVAFSGDCNAIVRGNAELLHRAIENVIRNAVKQTANGSTVLVDAHMDLRNNRLQLTILDCGPGVPEAELHTIFKPFFRGSGAAQNADGHGLGLAIAQHVITAHRGSIQARNREDGGLAIEIVLPARYDPDDA